MIFCVFRINFRLYTPILPGFQQGIHSRKTNKHSLTHTLIWILVLIHGIRNLSQGNWNQPTTFLQTLMENLWLSYSVLLRLLMKTIFTLLLVQATGKHLRSAAKSGISSKKQVRPEEILQISFTNKATEELKNRVSRDLDVCVDAKTFHKLGLDLITTFKKSRPLVAEEYFLKSHIQTYFASLGKDPQGVAALMTYFGSYLHIPEEFRNCTSLDDVTEICQNLQFETLHSTASNHLENIQRTNRITHPFEQVKSL